MPTLAWITSCRQSACGLARALVAGYLLDVPPENASLEALNDLAPELSVLLNCGRMVPLEEPRPYLVRTYHLPDVELLQHYRAVTGKAGEEVADLVIMDTYPAFEEEHLETVQTPIAETETETEPEVDGLAARYRAEDGALLGGMSDEELRRGVRVGRNNVRIRRAHRLGTFGGDVLLFVAEDSRHRGAGAHLWEPHVRGRITEIAVPCAHSDMVRTDMLGLVWAAIEARREPGA